MTTATASNPLDEARRLSRIAVEQGVTARLLGGAAVALSAPGPLPQPLQRQYKDLDFVVTREHAHRWRDLLEQHGYVSDSRFNSLHGAQRLLHFDTANGRQLDTFVGAFAMCHSLDLESRLPADSATLAPEDVLLTKLQIFEVNDKDLVDTIALLLTHPVTSGKGGIDVAQLAKVVATDWGWYTTISDNLEKVESRLTSIALNADEVATVRGRLTSITETMAATPKSLKWKMRAKLGRRVPWYDLPEEVE